MMMMIRSPPKIQTNKHTNSRRNHQRPCVCTPSTGILEHVRDEAGQGPAGHGFRLPGRRAPSAPPSLWRRQQPPLERGRRLPRRRQRRRAVPDRLRLLVVVIDFVFVVGRPDDALQRRPGLGTLAGGRVCRRVRARVGVQGGCLWGRAGYHQVGGGQGGGAEGERGCWSRTLCFKADQSDEIIIHRKLSSQDERGQSQSSRTLIKIQSA